MFEKSFLLDRATQWLAYRAASGYDPSSRSLRDRKEKEQEKGITKKGGRTTKKTRTYHRKGIAKKKLGSPQKLILTCYKQFAGKQTKESAGRTLATRSMVPAA